MVLNNSIDSLLFIGLRFVFYHLYFNNKIFLNKFNSILKKLVTIFTYYEIVADFSTLYNRFIWRLYDNNR